MDSTFSSASASASAASAIEVPPTFPNLIRDFTADLTTTFPEYARLWAKWQSPHVREDEWSALFQYCSTVYPERFFDILYQNSDIFRSSPPEQGEAKGQEEDEWVPVNTRFLPAVEFKTLYFCEGVTDTTRDAIWKYLQLVLMSVVNAARDKSVFGDTASMFEGVDEEELQDKLKTTLENITDFFKTLDPSDAAAADPSSSSPTGTTDRTGSEPFAGTDPATGSGGAMPNPNEFHEHLKGLFDGKIGHLAKELAEEISQDVEHMFDDELGAGGADDIHTTNDLIKKMMRNPKKIMGLMKTISGKLQQKMQAGDISEQDIMKEAGELMGKMKGMKGMGDMGDMLKHLAKGMGGGGRGGGINMGALAKMQRQMNAKERMMTKLEERRAAAAATATTATATTTAGTTYSLQETSDPKHLVFKVAANEERGGGDDEDDGPCYSSAAHPPPSTTQRPMSDEELAKMFAATPTPPSAKTDKKRGKSDKKKK